MKARGTMSILLSIAAAGLLAAALAQATTARAAPETTGGTFTVNGTGDNTDKNDFLTLREALYLSFGGTDDGGGLMRGLSDAEKAQISGCSWSSQVDGWHIAGSCGAGLVDTIEFDNSLSGNPIVLNSDLPYLNESAGTIIDGGAVQPTIDASTNPTPSVGLYIFSDHNVVEHLIIKAAMDGLFISGAGANSNTINDVTIWGARDDGIQIIDGSNNLINQSTIGVPSSTATSCNANKSNGAFGVLIYNLNTTSGGHDNQIKNSNIGCNGFAGVAMDTDSNTVGPNNVIGSNDAHTGNLGNNGQGVWITGNYNQVESNTIKFNSEGIFLTGNFNGVAGNTIRQNKGDGIRITSGAQDNTIGRLSLLGPVSGNNIGKNILHGIEITGTGTANNFVVGNQIGVSADGQSADGNYFEGIRISGSHDNVIGDTGDARNIIGSNEGDGIELANGAHDNPVGNNDIGWERNSGNQLPNGGDGVLIHTGAHDNTIGGSLQLGNNIRNNGVRGVELLDSGTTTNTLSFNAFYNNTQSGIRLSDNTHDNQALNNYLNGNGQNGIALANGAHDNFFEDDQMYGDAHNGVELSGAGTTGNVISHEIIFGNTLDGINERNGADANRWTHISTHDNGGLGIDKNGDTDGSNNIDGPFPQITSVTLSGGTVTVKGKASATQTPPTVFVEVYRVDLDPTGYGEGRDYLGTDTTDGNGNWSVSFSAPTISCYTAFQTVRNGSVYTSSEFGPNSCRTFLPLIER